MSSSQALTTKLPLDLLSALDEVCERLGLRKNFVIEQALREKIEDLLDAHDLEAARSSAVSFTAWDDVEAELRAEGKL
jgi:predicted transcriptional regulator